LTEDDGRQRERDCIAAIDRARFATRGVAQRIRENGGEVGGDSGEFSETLILVVPGTDKQVAVRFIVRDWSGHIEVAETTAHRSVTEHDWKPRRRGRTYEPEEFTDGFLTEEIWAIVHEYVPDVG